jgi:phosphopantothenoylcysteine decarboxylase/phosphopantothenate--cysteine ligase
MHILVTAGPTREYFDTVRFLSNPSSGKMGYGIAAEAVARGHAVDLVTGPVELPPPQGVSVYRVVSAEEMFHVCDELFVKCHSLVMTAAVCDYRPSRTLDHKLKKQQRIRSIHLKPTQDILAHLGKIKGDRAVVGFAMEDHDHRAHAESKLRRKQCDAIVLNGISNVGSDGAEIDILCANSGWSPTVSGTKGEMAARVMDLVESLVDPSHKQKKPAT